MIKHLACIMDGNRRWAKGHGKVALEGHAQGVHAAKRVVQFCLQKQIPYLSLYAFSTENLKRPDDEKIPLFELIAHNALSEIGFLKEQSIRVRFVGDRTLFPVSLITLCDTIEAETAQGTILNINLLFCYGARQEIVGGVKKIIQQVKAGLLDEQDISEESFAQYLWTHDFPEPDVIVRTGGAWRLSNFLLYQAAYSELYFLDCFWPEVDTEHLERMLSFFNNCQRNFGV